MPSFRACKRPPKRRRTVFQTKSKTGFPWLWNIAAIFCPCEAINMAGISTAQPCGTRKITFSLLRRISSMISSPCQSTRGWIFSGPRIASSAIIAIACGAVANISSTIASRSASLRSGKQRDRLINARRRELLPSFPAKRPNRARMGSRNFAGVKAIPAIAATPNQAPQ